MTPEDEIKILDNMTKMGLEIYQHGKGMYTNSMIYKFTSDMLRLYIWKDQLYQEAVEKLKQFDLWQDNCNSN